MDSVFASPTTTAGHRWRYGFASKPLPRQVDQATVRKSLRREVYFDDEYVGYMREDPEVVPSWKAHCVKPGLVVAGDYLSGPMAADGFVSGVAAAHWVEQGARQV